jgi:hypothetical protein
MLPHNLICSIGKIHRDFDSKDASLYMVWISRSKAVYKDTILKRLRNEMDIDNSAGHRPIKGKFMISADTRNEPSKYKRLLLENIRKEDVKESLLSNLENLAVRNIRKVRDTRFEISTSTWFLRPKLRKFRNLNKHM